MTAIADLCVTIRAWLNVGAEEYPDALVTSWVRMAEEWLSENLRVKHMVQIDWSDLIDGRVLLPSDWQELDSVRFRDGVAMIYSPRNEFYGASSNNLKGRYTIVGNYLLIGDVDAVNGTETEISYYQSIPALEEDPNWLLKYYSRVYILTTLWHAAMYSIEDERRATWQDMVFTFTNDMNERHKSSKSSGSVLVSRKRVGFG